MKTFIAFLLFTNLASAALKPSQFALNCITETPSTSFIGESGDSQLKVKLINHLGVESMPMHSGLVTIYDVALLAKRAEALSSIGKIANFFFPLSSCEKYQDDTFLCLGGSTFQTTDGKSVSVSSLSSSRMKQSYADFKYEQVMLNLSLRINGEEYNVPMTYTPEECPIEIH